MAQGTPLSRAPALNFYLWLVVFFFRITHLLSQCLKKWNTLILFTFVFIYKNLYINMYFYMLYWNCWQSLFYTNWTIWPLVLFVKVQCIYACLLQSARECQKGPAFAEPWVIANFSDVLMNVEQKQLCLKKKGSSK